MARPVACVGDPVRVFAPPGFTIIALVAGVPSSGIVALTDTIDGLIQKGSADLRLAGRGVAHIGDPVMVTMPLSPLSVTGSVAGTLTFPTPLSGTIEGGSSSVRNAGRGLARIGDSVIFAFPPTVQFSGTVAGQPLAGPIVIMTPVRGLILRGGRLLAA